AGLVVVDEHGGGDMHRGDEHHAVVEMRRRATVLDFVRDVDDLLPAFCVEGEIRRMCFHDCEMENGEWKMGVTTPILHFSFSVFQYVRRENPQECGCGVSGSVGAC